MNHRYTLEPYSGPGSRIMCPHCKHRRDTFKRYIDTHTQSYLADHVGRCDRQEQCGYHYPPRQYFADNPQARTIESIADRSEPCLLPWQLVEQSQKGYHRNNFVLFLVKLFGEEKAKELVTRYCIGTSKHWPGATVFWQLDYQEQVRAGKIMLYNAANCKRVKQPFNHIAWAHKLLNDESTIKQCFFGEHLLPYEPEKIVAIAESEKTAIIGAGVAPEYLWLAAGSLDGLTYEKCKVLEQRSVILFPDVNGYAKWKRKARELKLKILTAKFGIDYTLQRNATPADLLHGADIADKWIDQLTNKI